MITEIVTTIRAYLVISIICFKSSAAAREYGFGDNLVAGANIAGFLKVAEAMASQGAV